MKSDPLYFNANAHFAFLASRQALLYSLADMKNLLSIEQLSATDIQELLALGHRLKLERGKHATLPLQGQTWALIFSKSSTRTRVSFEVGITELGGRPMFLSYHDIQLGRGEPIKDTARVLGKMIHGAAIRTYGQEEIEEFATLSSIPTINALTDTEHPCQILADLLTIEELYGVGSWRDIKIAFVGDGNNNMARSWMWAAKRLGFTLAIGAPEAYLPPVLYRQRLDCANVIFTSDPMVATENATVINTDVWLSMGQEKEGEEKEQHFLPYQVNDALLANVAQKHTVLHCLPAYRGKEITEVVLERFASPIFQEAENRLHAQKAVLTTLANNNAR